MKAVQLPASFADLKQQAQKLALPQCQFGNHTDALNFLCSQKGCQYNFLPICQ